MYMYPEHLKARATMWLWQLRDLTISGVGALFSVFVIAQSGILIPALFTASYAFLTIQFEDTSILDFVSYACAFFFKQQLFEWRITE
ncbi:hypothetical protein [Hungatella effluvii]|uniref:hypothetical protein n=1 Tax=Hungatella effluvii TaxID=1096246 RepID=UPI0022E34B55|nr:hypothetical protein [Hungatella effluvii]